MLSAFTGWLVSGGASLILGFVAKVLTDAWDRYDTKRQQQQTADDAAKKSAVIAEHREPQDAAARLDRGDF